jgi:lysophospholipid hydrolase
MAEIQTRLAYISSVKQLDDAKGMDGVLCMRPDVLGYGTLEFTAFKKIFDAGYESGKKIIDEWQNQHVFQEYFGMPPDNESNKMNRRASI